MSTFVKQIVLQNGIVVQATAAQVGSGALASSSVLSGNVGSGQIGTYHLASGAITAGSISSGSITNNAVASGGFLSGALGSGAVFGSVLAPTGIASGVLGSGTVMPLITTNLAGQVTSFTTTPMVVRDTGGQVYNVLAYGLVGDGTTDNYSAFINNLLPAIPTFGGTIDFTQGDFLFSRGLNLSNRVNIKIRGYGGPSTNSTPTTRLIYTGSDSSTFLNLGSCNGFVLENLGIGWNNASYSGYLIDLRHTVGHANTNNNVFHHCVLRSVGSGGNLLPALVTMDGSYGNIFDLVSFFGGQYNVIGLTDMWGFVNAPVFRACFFSSAAISAILNPGVAWHLDTCIFEPLASGAAGAITQDSNGISLSHGLTITSPWMGDALDSATGTWITWSGTGLAVAGGQMFLAANTTGFKLNANNCIGINIRGVYLGSSSITNPAVGIDFGSTTGHSGFEWRGNVTTNVKTPIAGTIPPGSVYDLGGNPIIDILTTTTGQTVTSTSPNLLSLDQATAGVIGTGWNASANCTTTQSSAAAWEGVYSQSMTAIATGNMTIDTSNKIPVTAGTNYTFSAYLLAATTSRTVALGINWYNSSNTLLSSTSTSTTDTTGSWTQVSLQGLAPAGATQVLLTITVLSAAMGEVHYVDGAMLCTGFNNLWQSPGTVTETVNSLGYQQLGWGGAAITATSFNLLSYNQSTFEGPSSGWSATGHCAIALSSSVAWRGTHSLKMTGDGTGSGTASPQGSTNSFMFPVTPGQTYTFFGQVQAASANRTVQLSINYYDSTGTLINNYSGSTNENVGSWKPLSATGQAPLNAFSARLTWQVGSPANNEVHYLDGVGFVAGTDTTWAAGGRVSLNNNRTFWILTDLNGSTALQTDGVGHITLPANIPSIAAGTGAGTTPTVSISGSDQSGTITVTTGSTPSASATVATITFGVSFVSTPRSVILSAAGPNSASLSGTGSVYEDQASRTTSVFVLAVGSSALTEATTYKWSYQVFG